MRKLLTLVAIAVLTMTALPALAGGYDHDCDDDKGFKSWVPKDCEEEGEPPTEPTPSTPTTSTTTTLSEPTTTEGGVSDSTVTTPSTQPTTTDPGDDVTMSTLPFTGIDDPGSITAVAWSLLTVGGLVLLATRRRGDAEGELEKGE